MIVYELTHTYYLFKDDIYYSPRLLGFFESKNDIEKLIELYKIKPGFCDAPNGFTVRRREIEGNIDNNTFFEAIVYAHTYGYENYEYTVELGLFACKSAANNALTIFRNDNECFFRNTTMEIEEIVNICQINRRYCEEGFVVEEFTQ